MTKYFMDCDPKNIKTTFDLINRIKDLKIPDKSYTIMVKMLYILRASNESDCLLSEVAEYQTLSLLDKTDLLQIRYSPEVIDYNLIGNF